jgi:glutathione S-transferase
MSGLILVIGNKNYSSWSLRPWLVLRQAGLGFEEVRIGLHEPGTRAAILRHSPAGRVPVLHHGERRIWESIAICEYVAELAPAAGLWPEDPGARAQARSISAEMHAGFAALRSGFPMNVRGVGAPIPWSDAVRADIERVIGIWTTCRQRWGAGGPFLFGRFTIADAMYAPVVSRFRTYGVALEEPARSYAGAVWSLPAMQAWAADAAAEPEHFADVEAMIASPGGPRPMT